MNENTKPFDLELAKAGHPLVLSANLKIVDFHYFEGSVAPIRIQLLNKKMIGCSINGEGMNGEGIILLDTSEPWEAPLKQGDIVLKRAGRTWKEVIFIAEFADNKFLVYNDGFESYSKGDIDEDEDFDIVWKKDIKRKPTESDIEITVKVNGEFISLKDISEETLLKIRKNSK